MCVYLCTDVNLRRRAAERCGLICSKFGSVAMSYTHDVCVSVYSCDIEASGGRGINIASVFKYIHIMYVRYIHIMYVRYIHICVSKYRRGVDATSICHTHKICMLCV